MTPDGNDLNDPRIWIVFAKSDLALARKGYSPEVRRAALCYLCQQAVEKAVKAVLIRLKVDFPKTHQIQTLLEFSAGIVAVPGYIWSAAGLSDYAVEGRYPQNFEDVTREEYLLALKKTEAVVAWAEKILRATDSDRDEPPFARETPMPYGKKRALGANTHKTKKKK